MDPLRGTKHEFCAVNSKIFLSEHGKAMILITKPSSRTQYASVNFLVKQAPIIVFEDDRYVLRFATADGAENRRTGKARDVLDAGHHQGATPASLIYTSKACCHATQVKQFALANIWNTGWTR